MIKKDSVKKVRKPVHSAGSSRQIAVLLKKEQISDSSKRNDTFDEGREKYLGILGDLEISCFELDLNGNFTLVNDNLCKQFGYSRKKLLESNYTVFLKPDNIELTKQVYQEIYRTGKLKTAVNFEIIKKDGSRLVLEQSISLMKSPSGKKVIGFRGVARDITEKIKAEHLFNETAERYRTILDIMEEGYQENDLKGNYTFVNDFICRLLGYTRDEMIGMDFRKIHPPDVLQRLKTVYKRIYETGKPEFLIDTEVVCKDGSLIVLQTNAALIRDASGKPIGYRNLSRDVTERKRAEEALRKSEEKYRNILETMEEGLFETNLKGNYTFVNDAACRLMGYERNEMVGKNYRMSHKPETMLYLREIYTRMYETGKSENLLDYEAVRKDGSTRIHQANTGIIRDQAGEIIGFRALVRDITEREKAEEALRDSEERYRTILEIMEEAYAEYDLSGTVMFVNDAACRLLGYKRDEMIGLDYWNYHTPEVAKYVKEVFNKIYKTGKSEFLLDYEVIHKNGSVLTCQMNSALMRDASGKPKGFRILARDITGHKKAEEEKARIEEQLMQAQKMESVGRLAGGVAHDFNNMITVILGYAELIKLRLTPDNPLLTDLLEIEKAAGRSRDLTSQLLAFSRKAIIAPRPVELNSMIVDTQKTILHLIGEDIDLKFYPGESLWKIKVDPSQMEHILINLAVNARDAMPGGGKLTLETENIHLNEAYCKMHAGFTPGYYVLLGVSDEGVGMDRETLRQIFEPFFTTKETGKGTGLGLAMVYGIVKQNNGFINVYSEPEKGTTFKIYIPRSTQDAIEKAAAEEPLTTFGTGTVLLVEDDDMVRTMTTEMLQAIGYKTLSTGSPLTALSFFERDDAQIDLVITDVVMPGMSGRDLSERIEAIRPGVRVLFMSGYTTNVIAHRGVLDEGVYFIQKPFSMSDLARKIRSVINGT